MKQILSLLLFLSFLFVLAKETHAATYQLDTNYYITNGSVSAVAIGGTDTYIGGTFTYVGPYTGDGVVLDITSGTRDTSFPVVNGTIKTAVDDGSGGWYIGGSFTQVGSYTRNRLAHILSDGSVDATWNPDAGNTVNTIAISGSDIYAGGFFTTIGGQTRNRIAKLNNTTGAADATWNPDAGSTVYTIAISGSDIYAGGFFTTIGGQTRNRIAKLNNTTGAADATWNPDAGNIVYTIIISGSDIYVGGTFLTIGGQSRNSIAKLNNTTGAADATWNPDAGDNIIYTIAITGSDIYAGGQYVTIGGQSRNSIAKLNNTTGAADASWSADTNLGAQIFTIAISGGGIYAGGDFTTIGGQTRHKTAKLDSATGAVDATWNANAGSTVNAIVISGSDIYVGGQFVSITGQARNRIAKLNNTTGAVDATWNANAGSTVNAIVISGSDIYAGGSFTTIGGQSRNRIAKLNNTTGAADATWNANAGSAVSALAISGSDIYAGGLFSTIGGQTRNRIAKLNNTTGAADATWNANANSTVSALAISGSDIYAGGSFTTIGGQTRNYIAKLNNTTGAVDATWNANAGSTVNAIVISGSDIYAGGSFTTIGGQSRNRIAKLNNTTGAANPSWDPNANTTVSTIAVSGVDTYIGGSFTSVGGNSNVQYLAHLTQTDLTTPSISLTAFSPDPTTDATPSLSGTATDADGTVSAVDFQMDSTSGSWTSCTADDATFDEASEAFTCAVSTALSDGSHTIYVRASDDSNNTTGSGSEAADSFTVDTTVSTVPTLVSPSGDTKDAVKPTLVFKKATDVTSAIANYTVSLDRDKQRSFNIDGIPNTGGNSSHTTWKDDSNTRVEFFNENDSDSTNDEIHVYFKGLDTEGLTEGVHGWTVVTTDTVGNQQTSSVNFTIDKTPPTLSEVALASLGTIYASGIYQLPNTQKLPSISGKVTDSMVGSTRTSSNLTTDTFANVASGPDTITLLVKKLTSGSLSSNLSASLFSPNVTYTTYLTKDYSITGITETTTDKSARFYITLPYSLTDGYYQAQLIPKDKVGNYSTSLTFYLAVNQSFFTTVTGSSSSSLSPIASPESSPTTSINVPSPGPGGGGSLSGHFLSVKVVAPDKEPVPGARVTLHSTPKISLTNNQGIAIFTHVEPGEHTLEIAYDNQTGTQSITVNKNQQEQAVTVEMKLANPFWELPVLLAGAGLFLVIGILSIRILLLKNRNGQSIQPILI